MTMHPHATYFPEVISDSTGLADIRIGINGKTWHMWGRKGRDRELRLAETVAQKTLPVLLGAGIGVCLHTLVEAGIPVAVVDKEQPILEKTGLRKKYADSPNILWLDNESPQTVMDKLTAWQRDHGGLPFFPVTVPFYLRLDRNHYGSIAEALNNSTKTDFWSQARYPKFQSATPRVLFFDSNYFLCSEITTSLSRLQIDHRVLPLDRSGAGSQTFIEELLKTVIDFKPDFVLTVNHFGLDREGKLAELLNDLDLPLASWFVDNPHLIIHEYSHPGTDNTVIFTYDAGNLEEMRHKGFSNVHYLPLATDPKRFTPGQSSSAPEAWQADISFVGNSMTRPVIEAMQKTGLPSALLDNFTSVAAEFNTSEMANVSEFLRANVPDWSEALSALPSTENKLATESLITWEATRQYRLACVSAIKSFSPLIVGDKGWHDLLGPTNEWRYLEGIDYYQDLPRFYPCSKINFNCTSRQMIGAVNQRVFDVPACGGFILTDHRKQMEALFIPGEEIVAYATPEDIPGLVERYMRDENARTAISEAARKRILAHHTYDIRMQRLIEVMRNTA